MNITLKFEKYTGAGNDFVLIDDRDDKVSDQTFSEMAPVLCDRNFGIGGDGLMVIKSSLTHDFRMLYLNSDGSLAGMCGNGGRCISAFFSVLTGKEIVRFETLSGTYSAQVTRNQVALSMIDPFDFSETGIQDTYYLNTGTQHLVILKKDLENFDVFSEGKKLRYSDFAKSKNGANVNFIEGVDCNSIRIRTYEKGVENETLACGTGTVAGAIIAYRQGIVKTRPVSVKVQSGQLLTVDFNDDFKEVILTGPADFLFSGACQLQKENNQNWVLTR
ncbi:MAG: diaminopimelate epimerase [Bacteroidetes bacterium]|nr:diaminopimelate epimerase [Bacteroidota bacterium]